MSVLSIAQNVAKRAGFTAPSSLIGNADEIAIQLLAMIKEETRSLSDDFLWNKLVKRGTFTFSNGVDSYPLATVASDFKDYIPGTMWNYSTRRPIITPITPVEYEIQKNFLITSSIDKMAYIYNGTIYITPTPTSADVIYFEYTTLNIFQTSVGVGKPDITVDTDITTIREYLVELGVKLRFLVAKGIIPNLGFENTFEFKDYIKQRDKAIETDGFRQRAPITMSSRRNAYWLAAYTQDSDFPAI